LNPFDEPLGEGDELPRMEAVEEGAAAALPRLSIVHLLMWMAATAVAFLPLSWWNPVAAQGNTPRSTTASLSLSIQGLAAGTYLFVLAATLFWRARGYRARLEPGHWLALKGTAGWVQNIALIAILYGSDRTNFDLFRILEPLRWLAGLVFFVLFVWLAIRSPEPARWRGTFATFALAPVIGYIVGVALLFTVSRTPMMGMAGYAGAYAVQALVLLNAVIGDRTHGTPRHWTHWLAVVVYLISLAASTMIYAVYFMYPQILQAQ
jgi:hypothetical protein